jgi:hypothetical protein
MNEINRNNVLIEAVKNICQNCKTCEVKTRDLDTGEIMKVKAKYCKDGSGYIEIDLYNSENSYVESCKLKHPTNSCSLPFRLEVLQEPDCNCIPQNNICL